MIFALVEHVALYTPLILGAYLSLVLMKIPNLAIESAYIFGAIMAAKGATLLGSTSLMGLFGVVCAAGIGGMVVGLTAALLEQQLHISALLAAIMTTGLFYGVSLCVLGGTHGSLPSGQSSLRVMPCIEGYPDLCGSAAVALMVVFAFFVFMQTKLGVSCALYGDNRAFLPHYRVSTSYVVIAGLVMSNALAGISGFLVAQSNSFVDMGMGAGLPLVCLTALILGRSLIKSRRVISIVPPLCGLVFYFVLQQALLMAGFDLRYFMAVQAVVVVVVLGVVSRVSGRSYREVVGI